MIQGIILQIRQKKNFSIKHKHDINFLSDYKNSKQLFYVMITICIALRKFVSMLIMIKNYLLELKKTITDDQFKIIYKLQKQSFHIDAGYRFDQPQSINYIILKDHTGYFLLKQWI
ncbi:hypothetical protein pb186bvf_005690 [Paramecium bursaria]